MLLHLLVLENSTSSSKRMVDFASVYDASNSSCPTRKRVQRKFKRSHVIVQGVDTQWDGDLMDVRNLSKHNDGIQYIMVFQDIFFRFIFMYPLKQKTANAVIKGFRSIFEHRKPKVARFDKGSEFKNKWVKEFMKKEGVRIIFTQNKTKSNYAERAIQNIKNTHEQSNEYLNKLPALTKYINDTPSRPLGDVAPSDVNRDNEDEIRLNVYLVRNRRRLVPMVVKKSEKKKFKLGDRVRMTHLKRPFQREYYQKWTGEVFVVKTQRNRQGIPVYKLKDFGDEDITGTFYDQELQKVNTGEDTIWKIDRIIKERKVKGETEVLVSWLHWPSKFNSWIKKKDLHNV